jgi:hypothetical protein
MKRSIVTVVIAILVAIIAFLLGRQSGIEKPLPIKFPGAEKHEVLLSDAIKYVQNFRKNPKMIKINGGSLNRAIFDKILAQPDCDGIRYYYAQLDDSSSTLVLLGITANGSDLTKGTIAEATRPCPPYCDVISELK